MANHYFRMSYPNSVPVFETCIRCTTSQAVDILRLLKNPNKSMPNIVYPDILLPNIINEGDRSGITMEEVKAYIASGEIKALKAKNKPAPKNFVVEPDTIKSAYKGCGAKLKNFRNAPQLIAAVMANSKLATDPETLAQLVVIEVTKTNATA